MGLSFLLWNVRMIIWILEVVMGRRRTEIKGVNAHFSETLSEGGTHSLGLVLVWGW